MLAGLLAHDLDGDAVLGPPPLDEFPAIAAIGPDVPQATMLPDGPLQHPIGAVSIRNVHRMHDDHQQVPLGINKDMPLAPGDSFSPIEAALPAGFGRVHTLAVEDPGTWLRIPPCSPSCPLPQHVVDPEEGAIERPGVEVVPDGVPVGEVDGKEPPLAACAIEVEQGVDHLPAADDSGPPHVSLSFHPGPDQCPLLMRQIGRIPRFVSVVKIAVLLLDSVFPPVYYELSDFSNALLQMKIESKASDQGKPTS